MMQLKLLYTHFISTSFSGVMPTLALLLGGLRSSILLEIFLCGGRGGEGRGLYVVAVSCQHLKFSIRRNTMFVFMTPSFWVSLRFILIFTNLLLHTYCCFCCLFKTLISNMQTTKRKQN